MASMALAARQRSRLDVFVTSQFKTKCIPPPAETSFAGRTAIITGSNVGIGLETCRVMLRLGLSRLVMAVRTVAKGEAAAEPLRKAHPQAVIDVWPLDMLSYESIQAFAQSCAKLPQLDTVILNAAVFPYEFKVAETGHEEAFQVNYLSTALLSILLLPLLKAKHLGARPGRLTLISSSSALSPEFLNRDAKPIIPSFDDTAYYGSYMERYSTTKLLVLMLTHKLSQQVNAGDVIVTTVDPGYVGETSLHRTFTGIGAAIFGLLKRISSRNPQQGAWTYLDAVEVKGQEAHGGFIVDFNLHPFHTLMYTKEGLDAMERLWEETMKELRFADVASALQSLQV
ncbi:short chain dehydrogenase [Stachybotrys elegans]|uniref:Short chain dehydrogenase n=1 Tax=Stachybotrys elegans TaxID=80388 RepID=A0A8K0WP37_9HYPO|nr:short chain dehydrogenase [Stachybotrys elegans]